MKPMFTRVKEEYSNPVPVTENDSWATHNTHERGVCPTSTHTRKTHVARATHRITVTTTWGDGRKSKSYIDKCKCKFCGHTWDQEWMAA